MSKWEFEEKDFRVLEGLKIFNPSDAVEITNAKLKKWLSEGKRVYGCFDEGFWAWGEKPGNHDELTALLIQIEELPKKKCEHKDWDMNAGYLQCHKCRKRLRPTGFEVIE